MERIITRIFFIIIFLVYSNVIGQNNSKPYINKSLIEIDLSNQAIEDSLIGFGAMSMSCNKLNIASKLIVDSVAISWLLTHNIPFLILNQNLEDVINKEMEAIQLLKDKKSLNWYGVYRDLDEIEEKINDIVTQNQEANLITKSVIGQSFEGRDIWAIKLGSTDNANQNKPSILINSCQHAREWVTPMATTYLIDKLSQQYYIDQNINNLLNQLDIYIVPIVNPDGYIHTWEEDRWWRKNRQINNDNECVGTDLNRNWGIDWNGGESTSENPCSDIYVGSSPFSAPEAELLSDFISSIPNLVSHIDVHSYSALIVGPWGYTDEQTEDNDEIFCLGTKMQSAVSNTNNYPYVFGTGTVNEMLYLVSGGMVDWVYGSFPALSFLYELRPANLYYFDANFDGLAAFDNLEEDIILACEEFYQGALKMFEWAYIDSCELPSGCSDPEANNYYCDTELGNMGCLYNIDFMTPPLPNGSYSLIDYSLPLGFIDDGSCIYNNNLIFNSSIKKNIKILDVLGRNNVQNRFKIYLYDDGTAEKIFSY